MNSASHSNRIAKFSSQWPTPSGGDHNKVEGSDSTLMLGPFRLERPIAQGGMGVVWRGVHTTQGVPVAVKVLHSPGVRSEEFYADFQRELAAMVRLRHPRVIMVFDHGIITEEQELQSAGALEAGSPYFVMEYGSRGSLEQLRLPLTWNDYRQIILGLLEALSHAHSNGVIHRDIKPGNILLGSYEDARPGLKLTDFGIAHCIDQHLPSDQHSSCDSLIEEAQGTPAYMAPEQFEGRWREYGPCTDLYAFGIVAWELATGEVPFKGSNLFEYGMAHLEHDVPPFKPVMERVVGLQEWLETMFAKDIDDRFQSAAQAARAFELLGTIEAPAQPIRRSLSDAHATQIAEIRTRFSGVPETWRVEADKEPMPPALLNAGTDLVVLRQPPLLGRDDTMDALWNELRTSQRLSHPRVVHILASRGMGRSQILRSFGSRVQEVGCARTLSIELSCARCEDPVAEAFCEAFRAKHLSLELAAERIRSQLEREQWRDEAELSAVVRWVAGAAAPHIRKRALGRIEDRDRVLGALIRAMSKRAPLVLLFDDVEHAEEHVAWARRFEASGENKHSPVLIVCSRSIEREHVPVATPHSNNHSVLRLSPLTHGELGELLDASLRLAPRERSRRIAEAAGNPARLLGWLQYDLASSALQEGVEGFRSTSTSRDTSLQSLWRTRVAWLNAKHPELCSTLELAATVGNRVATGHLEGLTTSLHLPTPGSVQRVAQVHRFIDIRGIHWRFVSEEARQALIRSARRKGIHTLFEAKLSRDEQDVAGTTVSLSLAQRLKNSGARAKAYPMAISALRCALRCGCTLRAEKGIQQVEAWVSASTRPDDEMLRSELLALKADVALRARNHQDAWHWVHEVLHRPESATSGLSRAIAHDSAAFLARKGHEFEESLAHSEQAVVHYKSHGDPHGLASAYLNCGHTLLQMDRLADARSAFEAALVGFETSKDAIGIARTRLALGDTLARIGRIYGSMQLWSLAAHAFEREGNDFLARTCQQRLHTGSNLVVANDNEDHDSATSCSLSVSAS